MNKKKIVIFSVTNKKNINNKQKKKLNLFLHTLMYALMKYVSNLLTK